MELTTFDDIVKLQQDFSARLAERLKALSDRAQTTPEALVKVNAAGAAQLRPIAGTRPRADDPALDVQHEKDLLADVKENAEHVMLVDLARNDLGRVARAGSVHVDPYRVIERYSHVMHIVSGVKGVLAPGRDAFDLFAATFPAGKLVGAPPWPVRRHGRLLRCQRRHGPGDHDSHAGVPR